MKGKISFLFGFVVGCLFTLAAILALGYYANNSKEASDIAYLEQPVSYEDKAEAHFKVFQVLDNAALANERSEISEHSYTGNIVMLRGKDFYDDEVVTIKNPKRVGTFSYESNGGINKTVPVIE